MYRYELPPRYTAQGDTTVPRTSPGSGEQLQLTLQLELGMPARYDIISPHLQIAFRAKRPEHESVCSDVHDGDNGGAGGVAYPLAKGGRVQILVGPVILESAWNLGYSPRVSVLPDPRGKKDPQCKVKERWKNGGSVERHVSSRE